MTPERSDDLKVAVKFHGRKKILKIAPLQTNLTRTKSLTRAKRSRCKYVMYGDIYCSKLVFNAT